MKTIEIIMLRRSNVKGVGVCEEASTTHAEIENGVYLVKTKHAKYASDKDADIGNKFATTAIKADK